MQSRTNAVSNLPKRTWLASAITALVAASIFTAAPQAQARVFLSVNIAPPMLPVYEQPEMPGAGFFWTPGYWAYGNEGGYYWVPGTWVHSPYVGALWTPGYWGYRDNGYYFNSGYWGRHVGYYGGINYGFGYGGIGYNGGYWGHGGFFYNSNYNRFGGVHITNVYSRNFNEAPRDRFSFNGPGGEQRRESREEMNFSHERHSGPVGEQVRQREFASHDESLRASVNHGTPAIMATPRAGAFEHANAAHAGIANRAADQRGNEARAHTAEVHRATEQRGNRARTDVAEANRRTTERASNTAQHNLASHQHTANAERNDAARLTAHEPRPNTQRMDRQSDAHRPAVQQHSGRPLADARREPMGQTEHRGNPGAERQPHSVAQRQNPGAHGQAPRQGPAERGGGQHPSGQKPKDHDRGG